MMPVIEGLVPGGGSGRPPLAILTATVDGDATREFWETWFHAPVPAFYVQNGARREWEDAPMTRLATMPEPVGTVPAFARGMDELLDRSDASIIACLHDDVAIMEKGWVEEVERFFSRHPRVGLVGFGGAVAVGEPTMYRRPFDPMSLARHGFMSNMRDAEAHGRRVVGYRPVAVLDGFSLIGRRQFMQAAWERLSDLGIIHHAYDVAMGCLAKRWGWETWLMPLACHHAGGRTAVAGREYAEWASRVYGGDNQVWLKAHRIVWEAFKDVLPFSVGEE